MRDIEDLMSPAQTVKNAGSEERVKHFRGTEEHCRGQSPETAKKMVDGRSDEEKRGVSEKIPGDDKIVNTMSWDHLSSLVPGDVATHHFVPFYRGIISPAHFQTGPVKYAPTPHMKNVC